jgi:predicted  nucleic acid-binding Zn-ribbon protein
MPDEPTTWEQLGYHIRETLRTLLKTSDDTNNRVTALQTELAKRNQMIDTLQADYQELSDQVQRLREDVAVLRWKSGAWGALMGVVTALAAILLAKIK